MSQPQHTEHPTIINAPLNFRTSDTLITTKVPHYPPKVNTGTYIIPGWTRPNANGMNANINQADFNGPDFKARPLKHWRRQLRVYNNNGKGPSNNSRTARIVDLDRPGLTVYHHDPNCACVDNEGGNSYIIANNKFSYETKGNQYSEPRNDATIQNNGFNRVPSNATPTEVADPLTPVYEVLTGLYNTNCINCSPQNNRIKGAIAYNSQAYYADSFAKQQSRCQTYEQNISTNRADTSIYFGVDGEPLWPNNSPLGPQVVEPVEYTPIRLYNKPCVSQTIYKPNNVAFAKQGAVSGATRLRKLVADTVMLNGSSFYSAAGAAAANQGQYQGTNVAGNYYVKLKPVVDSCAGSVPGAPTLSLVNNLPNTITISWPFSGIGLCNILYYTLTYYAVGMDAIQVTVYPSANNVYTIRNLLPNTMYDFYMSATNGNGTSDNSELFKTSTLPNTILVSPSLGSFSIQSVAYNETVTITPPTSDSNGAFTYTGNNSTVATITSSGIVTIIGVGSVTITATQAATDNYSQGSASATLTVTQAVTTITPFTIPNQTYGDQPYQLPTPTSSRTGVFIFIYSSSNTNVATVSQSGLITIVGVGSVTITATQAATDNYSQGSASATLTVTQATLITPSLSNFSIPGAVVNQSNVNITITPPTSNSNGAFIYSLTNQQSQYGTGNFVFISGNVLTVGSPGSVTVVATQNPDGIYGEGTISATFYIVSENGT